MLNILPATEMTTFSNNLITYSVGDNGQIGHLFQVDVYDYLNIQGEGFVYSNFGYQIFRAGIMASANQVNIMSSIFGINPPYYTDFTTIKSFTPPNKNTGILTDSLNPNPIGLDIQQIYYTPPNNYSIVKVDVTATNNGVRGDITDLSLGYYFDWDIYPSYSSNKVELFPDAIPETFKAIAAGAEIQYYVGGGKSPFCACAVYSGDNNNIPQLAGLDGSMTQNFSTTDEITSLNSGGNLQSSTTGDKQIVAGMKFPGVLKKGESRNYQFFFGCSDTRANLAQAIKNAMLGTEVKENPLISTNVNIEINPQPAENLLNISINNTLNKSVNIEYYDILGCKVIEDTKIAENGNQIVLSKDISSLRPGIYFLKITAGEMIISKKFVKI